MSLTAKLLISLVIAVIASTLCSVLRDGVLVDPVQLAAFLFATVVTAMIVSAGNGKAAAGESTAAPAAKKTARKKPAASPKAASGAPRERGKVKWFNASKGFGFIIKDDGEEIFVHFRSIRGEGRRGLRDGQEVTFVVADSEKGPQAEDVEGLE